MKNFKKVANEVIYNYGNSIVFGWIVLFLTFLVLKIFGLILWSWWIVTAPIWSLVIFFILFFAYIGFKMITTKPYKT